ncbi:MAG: DUF5696 domain-containing protein [Treponema sp.]|nr:DUF5696 domain-containing protein [Treponema sp.]MCL2252088.1 DUF5696 domain-containing protein [Treponema sp.]
MKKTQTKFVALLILIFLSLFVAVSCNPRSSRPRPVLIYESLQNEAEADDVVIENEYLLLRFLPATAEIILTDKATGVEWRSNPVSPEEDMLADVITRQLMESQFSIDYADNSGIGMTLHSGLYSVQREAYEYEIVDGVLEVRYTVGDLARSYRIPPAMEENRMNAFLDLMEWEERGIVETTYRLYDINNLRMSDDRNQLLTDYPDLKDVKLWVLRAASPDYMKEIAEESFKQVGYTMEDYVEDSLRYEVKGESVRPAFSMTLRYILDGKSLVVNLPFDKIGYRPAYSLTQLALLPFMGSGNTEDRGYMLVPDGSGALINFNNGKQNQLPYSINIYGWDEAMPRDAVISDNKALFPAFGIHKNGASLFCIIEEGSAYASVRADVSGRNCSWNRVYPIFDMVHGAMMDIAERNQRAVYLYEATLPAGESITLRYTPCAEPGYIGMANEYRSWLLEKYPILKSRRVTGGIPIAVEIIGAVNKTQHRLGLPLDLPLKLTSYKETEAIVKDFVDYGWKNVHVKMNGWFNRSVDHTVPSKIKLISELGSSRSFKNIIATAEKNNYEVYPEVDFVFMRDVGWFSGFNLYRDAARYVNRERVQRYPYSFIWFGERTQWGKINYLARPAATFKLINNFITKAEKLNIKNIAFRNMGSRLAGDYHERRHVSREASMKMRQKEYERLHQAGKGILVHTGYDYSIPWASIITDMILDDQSFGITDTSVPFLPIVIRGYVPYTGRAINLAEDYTLNLLKTIECGAGLYFSFMMEETAELQETKFRQFYANEYNKWVGDADKLYKKFNEDFGHLYNQSIVNHEIITNGLTVTEYKDGTRVVVNASDTDHEYNGNRINSNSYIVLKQR